MIILSAYVFFLLPLIFLVLFSIRSSFILRIFFLFCIHTYLVTSPHSSFIYQPYIFFLVSILFLDPFGKISVTRSRCVSSRKKSFFPIEVTSLLICTQFLCQLQFLLFLVLSVSSQKRTHNFFFYFFTSS